MKKIITFSYEGIDVPFEVHEKYWMVDLSPLFSKKEIIEYLFDCMPEHLLLRMFSSTLSSNHPLIDHEQSKDSKSQILLVHYLPTLYIASQVGQNFELWLLQRYNEILAKYAIPYRLESNFPSFS